MVRKVNNAFKSMRLPLLNKEPDGFSFIKKFEGKIFLSIAMLKVFEQR
jgi:hypothetical protein